MKCKICKATIKSKTHRHKLYCARCKANRAAERTRIWKESNPEKVKQTRNRVYEFERQKNQYLKTVPVDKLLKVVKFKSTRRRKPY